MLAESNRRGMVIPRVKKFNRKSSVYNYPLPECRCLQHSNWPKYASLICCWCYKLKSRFNTSEYLSHQVISFWFILGALVPFVVFSLTQFLRCGSKNEWVNALISEESSFQIWLKKLPIHVIYSVLGKRQIYCLLLSLARVHQLIWR